MPKITIAQNILAANDTTAKDVQQLLATHGIRTVNMMSSPGAGKTTLLERTIERLRGQLEIGVIEGDIETGGCGDRPDQYARSVPPGGTHGSRRTQRNEFDRDEAAFHRKHR